MAKRIRLWRRTELPVGALGGYVLSGLLLCIGGTQPFGTQWRVPVMVVAIIVFLAGGLVHLFDKIDQHNTTVVSKIDHSVCDVVTKIDESVGDVYNTGKDAGVRNEALRQMHRHAVLVRSEPRLAVVPDSGSR